MKTRISNMRIPTEPMRQRSGIRDNDLSISGKIKTVRSRVPMRQTFGMLAVYTLVLLAACKGADKTETKTDSANATTVAATAGSPVTANQAVRVADTIPTGTDAEADTLLTDVKFLDPTIEVDMRYRNANNFTGAALPGYEGNRALMRREAAEALVRVQASLKSRGLGLKVWDAYRPVRATLAMVEWTQRVHRENLVTDGYIADRSKHNLGVAIDLTLIQLDSKKELDMGTPHDEFSEAAHTANATGAIALNRAILVSAMSREKFVNYDQEWWHFSYDVPNPLRFDKVVK